MRETWDESEVVYRRWSIRGFLQRLPALSRIILIATVGMFLVQLLLQHAILGKAGYEEMINIFGLRPDKVMSRKLCVWQLVTYMFLHSTGTWLHIIFNMFVFGMFGPEVERAMGQKRFGVLYFGAGIFAGLLSSIVLMFSATPIIGASGAVLGVLAAYGSLFPDRIVHLFMVFPMKAKHCVFLLAAVEVFATIAGNPNSEIASIAHLGGFIAGFLFIRYEWTLRSAFLHSAEHRYDRARESDRQVRERVDEILVKVNREGLSSLTWRERTFLKRASRRFKRQSS